MKKLLLTMLAVFLMLAPAVAQNVQPATGAPTITSKRYVVIRLNYAYAPGLAACFGGQSLYYYQLDPWASAFGGALGGQGYQNRNRGGFRNGPAYGGLNGGMGGNRNNSGFSYQRNTRGFGGGFGNPRGNFGNGYDRGIGRERSGW